MTVSSQPNASKCMYNLLKEVEEGAAKQNVTGIRYNKVTINQDQIFETMCLYHSINNTLHLHFKNTCETIERGAEYLHS